jgi:hypothetical protein
LKEEKMSDLDRQISEWRAPVESRLGAGRANELEGHLRSVIESLGSTGLPEHERLLLASHRVSNTDTLAIDSAKNDPLGAWRERFAWLLVGFVPLRLLLGAAQDIVAKFGSEPLNWGWSPWACALLQLFAQVSIFCFILGAGLWAARVASRPRSASSKWFPKSFMTLACMLVALVAACFFVPLIASQYQQYRYYHTGVDKARVEEFYEFLRVYGLGYLYPGLYIVAAITLAWLVTRGRAETEPAA